MFFDACRQPGGGEQKHKRDIKTANPNLRQTVLIEAMILAMPSCNTRRRQRVKQQSKGYKVRVPASFLVTSLLVSCFLAFCGGRAARYFLSEHYPSQSKTFHSPLHKTEKEPKTQSYLFGGSFGAAWNASTSCCLHKRDVTTLLAEENADLLDTDHNHIGSNANVQELVTEHLMVDIKNVDGSFLNSERRLANAMLEVVSEAHLTLRSYLLPRPCTFRCKLRGSIEAESYCSSHVA